MLNGVVYKLKCKDKSIKEFYIGSSCNMKERIGGHKYSCNNTNSKKYNYKVYIFIRENGGFENWFFETLLEVKVEHEEELRLLYEREFQLDLLPPLNIRVEGRTPKEWREEHKEEITNKKKIYYEDNKEEIAKQKKEKILCDCGIYYTKSNKARHFNTKKHKDYIKSLETNSVVD